MKLRFVLLFIVLVIGWMWISPNFEQVEDSEQPQNEILPEFTATGLEQLIYNKSGELTQKVLAKEMEHYTELSLTHFKQPLFTIYQDNEPFWQISALEGNIQEQLLTLDTNVVMQQIATDNMVQTISTEYLEIDLEANIVVTDNHILIQGDKIEITGKGLKVDLNEGTVSLTNHVETKITRS